MSRWQGRLNFKVLCSWHMSTVGSDSLTKFGNHKANQRDIPSSDKRLIFVHELCTHAANCHYITSIKWRQVKRASGQLCLSSDWSAVIRAGLWLADEASPGPPYGRVVYWLTCQVWPLITCNTASSADIIPDTDPSLVSGLHGITGRDTHCFVSVTCV